MNHQIFFPGPCLEIKFVSKFKCDSPEPVYTYIIIEERANIDVIYGDAYKGPHVGC